MTTRSRSPNSGFSRRTLLRAAAAAGALVGTGHARLSLAAGGGPADRKLVFVLLRGGMDGLGAVPAAGE